VEGEPRHKPQHHFHSGRPLLLGLLRQRVQKEHAPVLEPGIRKEGINWQLLSGPDQ